MAASARFEASESVVDTHWAIGFDFLPFSENEGSYQKITDCGRVNGPIPTSKYLQRKS